MNCPIYAVWQVGIWEPRLHFRLNCKYYPKVTVEGIGRFKDIQVYSTICITYVNTNQSFSELGLDAMCRQ